MRRPPRSTPSTTWTTCCTRCQRSDGDCPWPSRSGGCTPSRAWRPSSRPGPAVPSSPSDATSSSSAVTSSTRTRRAGAAVPHRRRGGSGRRAARRAAAGRSPPNATVATWLAAARFGRPDLCGTGRRLRLREPQGGVRHRDPRGDGVRAGRRGAPGGWAGDLRRGRGDGRSRRHPLAGKPSLPPSPRALRPGRRSRSQTPGRRRQGALVRERFSVDTMAAAPRRRSTGTSPRDAPGHQPGLRLSPLPAGHAGHGVAAGRRARRRGHRVRYRRDRPRVRLRARAPPAGAGVQPGGHPRRGPAPRRGRLAARASSTPPGVGAVETLAFQAAARGDDLLWEPLPVAKEVAAVVDRVRPDHVLVDHLAFSARLALTSAGVRHADVVLGHPSALTVGSTRSTATRRRGPGASHRTRLRSTHLHALCVGVRDAFTARWNDDPAHPRPVGARERTTRSPRPATCCCSTTRELHAPGRAHSTAAAPLLPRLGRPQRGAGRRRSTRGSPSEQRARRLRQPRQLPVRTRRRAGHGWQRRCESLDVRVAIASGSTDVEDLGPIPASWLVRRVLPQVHAAEPVGARWSRTAGTTA